MSLFSFLFRANAQNNNTITVMEPATFKEAIREKKVQVIDVRTPSEFKSGHIKNAINVDFFNSINFNDFFEKVDKEAPVYLYCRSGNRSRKAAKKLDSLGFKHIYDLKGGYMNWI